MRLNKSIVLFLILSVQNLFGQFMDPTIVNEKKNLYTASFVAEWAKDTASVETFSIIGNHLFGKAIHLYPEPHLQQFEFNFNDDGSIREMDVQFYSLENSSIPLESKTGFLPYRIKMNSDHGVADFRSIDKEGEKQWVHKVPRMDFNGGWIPIMGQWQWLTDKLLEGQLDGNLKFINIVIGDYDLSIKKKSNKEVIFKSDISAPIRFYLDSNGKIDSINALGSPWNYKIYRRGPIDIETLTSQFAKKKVMGNPSPRETFQSKLGNTKISVSYGSPSKRGRIIFGELVPFDQVWRTGAGSTTMFVTNSALVFGEVKIPKGSYNLFTVPNESNWILIFNTEPEAWGSAHRAEFDFAKTPMSVQKLDSPVEKFTIEIESTKNGGELIMKWDYTKVSTSFTIDD